MGNAAFPITIGSEPRAAERNDDGERRQPGVGIDGRYENADRENRAGTLDAVWVSQAGLYRIFLQFKRAGRIETAFFDARVR